MASDSVDWKLWFLPLCEAISSESQTLFKTLFPAISSKQLSDLEGEGSIKRLISAINGKNKVTFQSMNTSPALLPDVEGSGQSTSPT